MSFELETSSPVRRRNPVFLFQSLAQNYALIKVMITRELESRYKGSVLGPLWFLVTPILMMIVFTFVFGFVFEARVPYRKVDSSPVQFGVFIFSGLILFTMLSDVISAAPSAILNNAPLVKKVVFPHETFAVVSVVTATVNAFISMIALLAGMFIIFGSVPVSALIYPFLILSMTPMLLGLHWILSSLGTYMRDISEFIGVSLSALMFLSPIFMPLEKIPAPFSTILIFNPVSVPVEAAHIALFKGELPAFSFIGIYGCVSIAMMLLGWWVFQTLRDGFADVV